MKKALLAAILGIAAVSTSFGQGHVLISNYATSPYNQVVWDAALAGFGGTTVNNTAVQLQVWYGLGTVADANALTAGQSFTISASSATLPGNAGNGGWFLNVVQVIPTWQSGQTYTFQIRASGDSASTGIAGTFTGATSLWQETAKITSTAGAPLAAATVPGLTVGIIPVPEPSTFALAGLGSAALLMFRRKK